MALTSNRSIGHVPLKGMSLPNIFTIHRPVSAFRPTRNTMSRAPSSRFQIRASSSSSWSAGVSGTGVVEANPFVPLLATAGFAAAWFNKYSPQREHVLIGLAAVALVQSATSLFKTGVHADWVSNLAAPAVLAWHALNLRYHYMEVAIAVFGWQLSKNLPGPAVAWAATLAAALYKGLGAEWYAAAYAATAGWKLFSGTKGDAKVGLQLAPPVIASAWALYKRCPLTWVIVLMLSQIAGSAFTMVRSVINEASSSSANQS